jgi:zinc D-Ala-D-Ala carboxypeptidase
MDQHDRRSPVATRRHSIPGRLVLLVAGLALAATACLPPAPKSGLQNGFLPDSVLQTINSNCQIWKPAAPSLLNMMASAHVAGVELTPESCYRSYAGQVAVRNYWCSLGLCPFAAVPGTSLHGWGKAVDFADQNGELTFSSVGYQWLTANAGLFCFVHPPWAQPTGSAPEPWHWEWTC